MNANVQINKKGEIVYITNKSNDNYNLPILNNYEDDSEYYDMLFAYIIETIIYEVRNLVCIFAGNTHLLSSILQCFLVGCSRRIFIDKGVPLLGYSDRRIAEKYNVPYTGNAWSSFTDVPSNGNVKFFIKRSPKTTKELLAGRLTIVLDNASGGGFNEKGDYVMPVHHAFLCDGEKFLGSLPPFTLSSNMFDMFGKDFIGVGSDQPVFNDKQVLVKVKISTNV